MRIEFMPFLALLVQAAPLRYLCSAFEGFIKSLDGRDLRTAGFTFNRPLVHRVN
jgi:hypothetical protein